ncbi:MAG TPA: hypothetical protein VIL52_00395, partial [Bacteroidota bacterium]
MKNGKKINTYRKFFQGFDEIRLQYPIGNDAAVYKEFFKLFSIVHERFIEKESKSLDSLNVFEVMGFTTDEVLHSRIL